jgi:hypothetical protein
MSEQELIHALRELISKHAPPVDSRRVSVELLARDRIRVGLLAGVTALLWLGGIAGVLYMVFCFNRFIVAYAGGDPPGITRADNAQAWEFHAKMELHHALEYCMAALPALLLAALGTVWLVLSSRRATLNQINVSLAEISEQVRRLWERERARGDG